AGRQPRGLRPRGVDRLQQHAFALDAFKKALGAQGKDLWSLLEDKQLLERFFASVSQAGGIKVFMDATADTNMADFAKVMATVKTLELGQLVGAGPTLLFISRSS
ncbi:unnamed protein product, partial [Polarella glacialis]